MELNDKLLNEFELTDQQQEEVIAGAEDGKMIMTVMYCEECRYRDFWSGDYMNGQYYNCPHCKKFAFHGIKYS